MYKYCMAQILKPGGFLKLFLFACWHVCVCACVCVSAPEAAKHCLSQTKNPRGCVNKVKMTAVMCGTIKVRWDGNSKD